jgi:predicted phage terminase large subunit-like protein
LFEEHKPLKFLLEQKKLMTLASWESEYQQHPMVPGGGMFPRDKLTCIQAFDRGLILASVRYWDKAGTEHRDGSQGAYTAGVLMHKLKNGLFVIEHVVRGHWGALERERKIEALAALDRKDIKGSYEIVIEQEPGSGGKESAEATLRALAGYRVFADRVTGSKVVRAEPFAAQVQAGNVFLLPGDWVRSFLDEAEVFPNGKLRIKSMPLAARSRG